MDEKLASRISVGLTVASGISVLLLVEYFFPSLVILGTLILGAVSMGCAYEASHYSEENFTRKKISFLLYSFPVLFFIGCIVYSIIFQEDSSMLTHVGVSMLYVKFFAASVIVSLLCSLVWVVITLRNSLLDAEKFLSKFFLNFFLIGIGGLCAVLVSLHAEAPKLIFTSGVIVALSDIVAYFVGPKFSLVKLAVGISPQKSLAGSIVAMIVGAIVGSILSTVMFDRSLLYGASFGCAVSLVSVFFDLSQSLSKRLSGVKDSGTVLKAHGGIFDRFDGQLGGMMVTAFFVLIF